MAGPSETPSFEQLQGRLAELRVPGRSRTVLVLPSISFPDVELRKITGIPHYEERLLCLVSELEDPNLRMIYVTSLPVDEGIVDYYMRFLGDPSGARSRLTLVSIDSPGPRALSRKLLDEGAALEKLRSAIPDPSNTYIVPFNVTEWEKEISEALGVPVLGPRPSRAYLGTKSGARKVARRAGVDLLPGAEDVRSPTDIGAAIEAIRGQSPAARSVVIKLNNGFSGQGNALLDVESLAEPLDESPTVFCAQDETWPAYAAKIAAEGAVVEELARAEGVVSPSVQLRIHPGGEVEILSTHDQILGGPDNQVYLGCRFPARAEYRRLISGAALRVGRELAAEDVVGSFGIDFVLLPDGDGWRSYLSEINLRLGGTTHPFIMAKWITGGFVDAASGEMQTDSGPRSYVASDNIKSPAYVGRKPRDILDALESSGLAYDPSTRTGTTLHLLGALNDYGKLGCLCVAASPDAAESLFEEVIAFLDELTGARSKF